MISNRLKDYLDSRHVDYSVSTHRPAYTAIETARSDHTPERQMAKTVVFMADGAYGMALLPANMRMDARSLGEALGSSDFRLATESELLKLFPDVEVGAMPPFANLYGMPVYIDEHLASQHEVAFNAGSHWKTIHMKVHDLIKLSDALVRRFARRN
ncbi:MAG TPA: YbaK/EbsC family protein [Bryobacteraceae bacterium]|jgi:Ala-tRNA(Pro) deacylase|nr:YbaK/EbsC family protein [Bryobacteraceae bacterium]